ncbi:MAG: dephospho-CoA kinase [Candidatus Saccharimonadaceae bacterium]
MIKIGITGGIGSGKSIIASLFELHGIPVYNADKETKILNNTSTYIRNQLSQYFGKELYESGILNNKKFAEIIFSDPDKLRLANSIIHPEVLENFNNWCFQNSNNTIIALEAAILFESNFNVYLDKVVTVYSPQDQRISQVALRDNVNTALVTKRIEHQMPEKEKINLSDYVIINDYESSLIVQVHELLNEITQNSI